MTSPLLFWSAAGAAVTLQGLSKGGFAGIGMASTPLLALAVPPLQGAAILLPIMMLQDAISVWTYRRHWSAWNLKVMLAGAVLGVGIAWALAAHISDACVRLAVGLIALAFVLYRWLAVQPAAARPSAAGGVFWGALSAFTSAFAHAGAPPFQIHVLPQRLDKLTFVGTSTLFFAAVNLMKVVPYVALGQFSPANLTTSAMLAPLAVATNYLGIWLVRRTPSDLFYRLAYALVFVVSLELIRDGTMALWQS